MKRILFSLIFWGSSSLLALPFEIITQKGDYLKGLVTQVQLKQFKNDAQIFFEFDPEFPPSTQALLAYKQVADELVEHAKVTRAEKFEERKLLLGTTIHDTKALLKFLICGAITLVGIGGTGFATAVAITAGQGYNSNSAQQRLGIVLAIIGALVTSGFGYLTKHYRTHAVSKADVIAQEMKMLNEIIDYCKDIQRKMHTNPLLPAVPGAQTQQPTITP